MKKRLLSFKYAFQGVLLLFKTQVNARIHLAFMLLVIGAGFFFDINKIEWLLCILCIGLVLAAEAINSALEFLADTVTKEYHPLIKKSKDLAAAAVLFLAFSATIIGIIIFLPRVLQYFQ